MKRNSKRVETKTWPSGWCLNTGLCFSTALISVNMPTYITTVTTGSEKIQLYQSIVRSCGVPPLASFIKLERNV